MRIIGIDPGYATVGYGVIDYVNSRFTTVNYGAIITKADLPFEARIAEIHSDLCELLRVYTPQFMAVERLFFTTNQKTAIDVAQARGVILLSAVENRVKLAEYTPLQVKQSVTGYGKATKSQVQEMTKRILELSAVPKPDDTADALAIAICHAHTGLSVRGVHNLTSQMRGLK
jgi:crossover junction endodeoxyribonuclease RuvC